MKTIQPKDQPQPKGHYSPGIEHHGIIYVSGQLPMDLETREPFAGDIETQTELALRNVEVEFGISLPVGGPHTVDLWTWGDNSPRECGSLLHNTDRRPG